jgi:suppressor of fused-like protein
VDDTDAAPGWDAIDSALRRLYPDVEPKHYGTVLKRVLGGPDPLDGISVYPRPDHWHFVSYGLSALYDMQSSGAEESGWGFELTFRLSRTADEGEPPNWALNFLQNLARYVFNSGNPFALGHHMDLNGPISLSRPDTAIRAIAFAQDPELGTIDTPNGQVRFLQVVGLTLDEYAVIERWDARRLLEILAARLPLSITDLERASVAEAPDVATMIAEGVRRDGSSTDGLFVQEASCRVQRSGWRRRPSGVVLTFGANAADRIARVLSARLPFGRDLTVAGPEGGVVFRPGTDFAVTDAGDGLVAIQMPADVLGELVGVLRPAAGTYPLRSAPDLRVQIVTSQIRDQAGEVVAEVG